MLPRHAYQMAASFVGHAKALVLLATIARQDVQAESSFKTPLSGLFVDFASRVVLHVVVFLEKVVLIRLEM